MQLEGCNTGQKTKGIQTFMSTAKKKEKKRKKEEEREREKKRERDFFKTRQAMYV